MRKSAKNYDQKRKKHSLVDKKEIVALFLQMIAEIRSTLPRSNCRCARRPRTSLKKTERRKGPPNSKLVSPLRIIMHKTIHSCEGSETTLPSKEKEEISIENNEKIIEKIYKIDDPADIQDAFQVLQPPDNKELMEFERRINNESFPYRYPAFIAQRNVMHIQICYDILADTSPQIEDPTRFCRKIRSALGTTNDRPHRKESIEIYRDDTDDPKRS